MTKDTHEDKAQDSASIQLEKPDESTMNQAIASSLRDSASLQPDSLLLMPIQPGGVMIPSGSQDQRPNNNDQSHGKSSHSPTADCDEGCPEMPNVTRDPLGPGVTDQAGKTVRWAQVESTVSTRISGQVQDGTPEAEHSHLTAKGQDDKKTRYPASTCARQATGERTAAGQEAARAQAVEMGHQVTLIEVPDKEDDTAYQRWITKVSPIVTPTQPVATLPMPPDSPIQIRRMYTDGQTYQDWQTQSKETSPMVVAPTMADAKVREVPRQGWMRLLLVDWTLQNV